MILLLRKCNKYKIPYEMMKRLNYTDLLAMIVEYDIDAINDYLRQKKQRANIKNGVEVREANNAETLAFFKGGR